MNLPWDLNIENPKEQPCCKPIGSQCKLHPIFEGINDWKLMKLHHHREGDPDKLEETKAEELLGIADRNAIEIEMDGCGALNWKEGHYIVKQTSDLHILQQDELWGEFDPLMKANKGDLACNAHCLYKLPRARNWHCHASDDEG